MTFTEFQTLRQRLLTERPALMDAAEPNLYRALAHIAPSDTPAPDGKVHRCHLASQWCDFYGLPAEISRRAFVTTDVRHSLDILFRHLAGKKSLLWLPEDNYPVYHELAAAHGHVPQSFATLPLVLWPEEPPADEFEHEWLLITNPLKPCGCYLSAQDAVALEKWLSASPRRRAMLDTVYMLDQRFDAVTLRLLATGQVILLHSLTKSWLRPRCFGIALMPEDDAAESMPVFRESAPPQANLAAARHFMANHADTPAQVTQALVCSQKRLAASIRHLPLKRIRVDPASYFVPVMGAWDQHLENNVLGLPASVFGTTHEEFTVLSSLSFIQTP